MAMVTRKCNTLLYYRLHFLDMTNDTDVTEEVTSRNIQTLRYYANKARRTRNLWLCDFVEVWLVADFVWLTKYRVRTRERNFRFKEYYRPIYSVRKTFDEFLGIPPVTQRLNEPIQVQQRP
jgi:hypothetical protein